MDAVKPSGPTAHVFSPTAPALIGRDPDADITLGHPTVSWRHAKLVSVEPGRWLLTDLGSTNGTYVNGRRVQRAHVTSADIIMLGGYLFHVGAHQDISLHDLSSAIRLDARDVLVVRKDQAGHCKAIVDRVSFTVYPHEFIGLMGLSGAGKTTLMLTLSGHAKPEDGAALFNGFDLYANYSQFRALIGYVPQENVLHKDLTVGEALYYAARLRLPKDTGDAEILRRIDDILMKLQLLDPARNVDVRQTTIGSTEKKGISGGQKKRVTLAMELLTEPGLIFLDEPTSGLSAVETLAIMRLLRQLADKGVTVVVTIHQPDIESYRMMDNILILHHGKLVYYGRSWPDSISYFNPGCASDVLQRPEKALLGVNTRPAEEWQRIYETSHQHREFVAARSATLGRRDSRRNPAQQTGAGFFDMHQFLVLTRRNFRIKVKDVANTWALLLQAPFIAVLLVMLFGSQKAAVPTPLFFTTMAAIWLGTSNSLREIVSERAVFMRERMLFLGIAEYLLSKYVVLACLCVIQCAILAAGLVMANMRGSWFSFFAMSFLISQIGLGLGLLLSAVSPSQKTAMSLLPLVLLPMIILGGSMVLPTSMSGFTKGLSTLAPTRWGYEAFLHLEDEAGGNLAHPCPGGEATPPVKGKAEPRSGKNEGWAACVFGRDAMSLSSDVTVLLAMLVLLFATTGAVLGRRAMLPR